MYEVLDTVLGLSLKSEQLGIGQMAARAFVMYVAVIVIVRSGKKRFIGRATAFDFILTIMAGSIAARAITGGAPFVPGVASVAALVASHWLFSFVAQRSQTFSWLIKGTSTRLIENGRVDRAALRAAHMSDDDLEEDLREQGVGEASEVAEARLERSGKLSVIKRPAAN